MRKKTSAMSSKDNEVSNKIKQINSSRHSRWSSLANSEFSVFKSFCDTQFRVDPKQQPLKCISYRHNRNLSLNFPAAAASKSKPGSGFIVEKEKTFEKLPLTAEKAKIVFENNLNEFEQKEIVRYKEIYYVGNKEKESQIQIDDEKKNLVVYEDDHIAYRYQVKKLLGTGTFSQVYEAYDWKTKKLVAIKIIRNKEKYSKQAETEVLFLKFVKEKGCDLAYPKILADFEFRNHACIVFKIISKTNFDFITDISVLIKISNDILSCLQFLHENRIVHCDVKPVNILINNKNIGYLIDLGTATYIDQQVFKYVQSRNYRAPEVILRLKYSEKIDIWSFGCSVFELATGSILFEGDDEKKILEAIVKKIGRPPKKWLKICDFILADFKKNNESQNLEQVIKDLHPVVQEIIAGCLRWDPKKRISASEALNILRKFDDINNQS